MSNKVVLAYSGGLDTSIIIQYLKDQYDLEVHCFAGDGQLRCSENWPPGLDHST